MVYYLHGNVRCPTCREIEATSEEAVTSGFAGELKSGQVQWQVINYETPGNEHYTRTTKSWHPRSSWQNSTWRTDRLERAAGSVGTCG